MMRFYAPFITEATLQVTMALRSERAMVGRRQKYDEEAAYESYMNPEPGFQSGPGDAVDAD